MPTKPTQHSQPNTQGMRTCHSPMDTNNKMDFSASVIHTIYNSLIMTLQFIFWTQNHNFMMCHHPMHRAHNEIITFHPKNYYHRFTINCLNEHMNLTSRRWSHIKSHGNSKWIIFLLCWLRWESLKMKDLLLLEHQNLP
jgi:hypothetical protein